MKKIVVVPTILFTSLILLGSCNGNQESNQTDNKTEKPVDSVPLAEIDYLEIGKDLTMQTKTALSDQLISAITERGADGAVEFCNIQAIPITDSMALVLDAKIKRVSDRPRNPFNMANKAELDYIKKWKDGNAIGEEQKPIVTEIDGKMVGYYPIVTNQMCLQCHGKPEKEINMATHKNIKKLYPTDLATGYGENEIRGIFVIEMNKK